MTLEKHIELYHCDIKADYKFRDYKLAKECGFSPKDYEKAYEYDARYPENKSDLSICENVFRIFNSPEERPSDYHGYSLSVSDVVVVNGKAYYCDDMGFVGVDFKMNPNQDVIDAVRELKESLLSEIQEFRDCAEDEMVKINKRVRESGLEEFGRSAVQTVQEYNQYKQMRTDAEEMKKIVKKVVSDFIYDLNHKN